MECDPQLHFEVQQTQAYTWIKFLLIGLQNFQCFPSKRLNTAPKFQVNMFRDLSVMVHLNDVRNLFCKEQHKHENNVVFEDKDE